MTCGLTQWQTPYIPSLYYIIYEKPHKPLPELHDKLRIAPSLMWFYNFFFQFQSPAFSIFSPKEIRTGKGVFINDVTLIVNPLNDAMNEFSVLKKC